VAAHTATSAAAGSASGPASEPASSPAASAVNPLMAFEEAYLRATAGFVDFDSSEMRSEQ